MPNEIKLLFLWFFVVLIKWVFKLKFEVKAGGKLNGTFRVPGDKSISHRSIMLGWLAEGVTHVSGFLEGEDSLATLNAFRAMGVQIDGPTDGNVTIHGVGLHGLKKPDKDLDEGKKIFDIYKKIENIYITDNFELLITSARNINIISTKLELAFDEALEFNTYLRNKRKGGEETSMSKNDLKAFYKEWIASKEEIN